VPGASRTEDRNLHQKTHDRWTPALVVSDVDWGRLNRLATAAMDRIPEIADELLSEMERATVVERDLMPPNVVQMGSTVEFASNDGQHRRVTLVFPADADIAQGKISVLTPVGTALIGLTEGQSIKWTTRDGREPELTVLSVKAASAG
jgi:regulator of nucleoside diphosphate kinase